MAQFDVYPNPSPAMAPAIPYIVDIQADCVRDLPTRVLVPLARPSDAVRPTRHLNPLVAVAGEDLVLLTEQLAAVPTALLGDRLASLAGRRDDIVAALDFLFTGI
jgi:toxin CcdB